MDYAAGSRKDPNINQIIIKNCLIPISPKKEQDRIVSKYNALFPLIDNYSETNEQRVKLNTDLPLLLKKSILQEAIQGHLVPQDPADEPASALLQRIKEEKLRLVKGGKLKKKDVVDSVIYKGDDNRYYEKTGKDAIDITDEVTFEIPDTWAWVRLVNIGITETGTPLSKTHPEYFGIHIPFLGPANIQNNIITSQTQGLSELGMQFARVVPENTILQVCIGGSIGKCAITDKSVTFNQQINSITPICCVIEYVHFVLQSESIRLSIMDKATGTATPIINKSNWESLFIPLPPYEEQKRIVKIVNNILNEIKGY